MSCGLGNEREGGGGRKEGTTNMADREEGARRIGGMLKGLGAQAQSGALLKVFSVKTSMSDEGIHRSHQSSGKLCCCVVSDFRVVGLGRQNKKGSDPHMI